MNQFSNTKEGPDVLFQQTDEAGRIHNQALEYAFHEFRVFVDNKSEDYDFKSEEFFELGRNSSINFLNNCRNPLIEEVRELAIDLFNRMFEDQRVCLPKPSSLILLAPSSYFFSPKQLNLLEKWRKQ